MHQKPHLELAHEYWKSWLKSTDTVIDATCGNGKDTLRLAHLVPEGLVLALDIQETALQKARATASLPHVSFYHQSHATFPTCENVKLIVYNLGYLPGGDKSLTTHSKTTLASIEKGLSISQALSVTCYPGHPEGAVEESLLRDFFKSLDPEAWDVTYHFWKEGAPSLFWVFKKS